MTEEVINEVIKEDYDVLGQLWKSLESISQWKMGRNW